ncbi:MAG: hypothetical protein ACJ8IK_23840 [Burkholderiaceae bacterium]|jgi:hypothetical protein
MRFLFRSLVATARPPLAAFPRHFRGREHDAAELGAGRALSPEARRPALQGDYNDRGAALRSARPHWEV